MNLNGCYFIFEYRDNKENSFKKLENSIHSLEEIPITFKDNIDFYIKIINENCYEISPKTLPEIVEFEIACDYNNNSENIKHILFDKKNDTLFFNYNNLKIILNLKNKEKQLENNVSDLEQKLNS